MDVKKAAGIIAGFAAFAGFGLYKIFFEGTCARYSDKWFHSLSDDELGIEREKARQEYLSAGDFKAGIRAESILNQFDREMGRRAWEGSDGYGYPKHTEHGWYLSGDD